MNTNPGSTPSSANADATLPAGFEDLQPFVAWWSRSTNDERWDQRARAPMEDIRAFYDTMLARSEDVLAYLEPYPLGEDLPPDVRRLAQLLLALGQAAIAVEMHDQPRSPYSAFPHDIHVIKGPWPLGGTLRPGV